MFGPLVLGAVLVGLAWHGSERARTRYAFLAAVLASVVLFYEALLFSLCGLGENTTKQCGGGADLLVLLWIPVLLLAALAVSRTRALAPLVAFAALLLIVLLSPLALHSH